jgi:hypothetical protein
VDPQEHAAFKELLHRYEEVLQDASLPRAERARAKATRDKLEAALFQIWLPPGLLRRTIIQALAMCGLYTFFTGSEVPPWVR